MHNTIRTAVNNRTSISKKMGRISLKAEIYKMLAMIVINR
jgi:hypothetical protein